MRDIAAGEELLWDYNLYDDDDPCTLPLRFTQVPWNHVFAGMDGQDAAQGAKASRKKSSRTQEAKKTQEEKLRRKTKI